MYWLLILIVRLSGINFVFFVNLTDNFGTVPFCFFYICRVMCS